MAAKIKRGDKVVVISGAHKGASGEVTQVFLEKNRALVQGVNFVTKHVKPTQEGPGKKERKEASLHLSNLAHIDPSDQKPCRVAFKTVEGKKIRVSARTGTVL